MHCCSSREERQKQKCFKRLFTIGQTTTRLPCEPGTCALYHAKGNYTSCEILHKEEEANGGVAIWTKLEIRSRTDRIRNIKKVTVLRTTAGARIKGKKRITKVDWDTRNVGTHGNGVAGNLTDSSKQIMPF